MRDNSGFTEENGIITCDALKGLKNVAHGFTTRVGGVSSGVYGELNLGSSTGDSPENVRENYHIVCSRLGMDDKRLTLTKQTHSDIVINVTEEDSGKGVFLPNGADGVDGLITAAAELPIAVFTADCTPILLYDSVARAVGAVHSGWRGTLAEIGRAAVLKMSECFGSRAESITAAIGPSIKKCHFEVSPDVYESFFQKFGSLARDNSIEKSGKYYIDTDAINIKSLEAAGILRENIHVCPRCTFCESGHFFSHRASGGKTGRMCALIMLKK